ncbi:MAG: dihydroorotase [Betaproteobacteria bacterium]
MPPDILQMPRPDDLHVHFRDGPHLGDVVGATAQVFGRAIVMPNLKPPVTTTDAALSYRQRVVDALPAGTTFTPLMTLYLTDNTTAAEIDRAKRSGAVHAVKYYPAGATTNAESGVTALSKVGPVLDAMQRLDVVLSIHGEVTDADIDVFDRERVFIDRELAGLVRDFPQLRIVLEHVTTAEGAAFVAEASSRIAATITPQHLLYSRSALFAGGLRPHLYCLPVLKRETHRRALVAAATSGNPKFFLGTDSAPHATGSKENACGCAGCYTAPLAMPLYAEAFEDAGALDRLAGFAGVHGAAFYRLPPNDGRITLERGSWPVPDYFAFGDTTVTPLRAGTTLRWRVRPDHAG